MSAPPTTSGAPVTDRRQLVDYIASGNKPKDQWRIGTEHEKFGFIKESLKPMPYDGPHGIRAMLEGLRDRYGWQEVLENGKPIALLKDGCSVTLEPGGQLELSGAPLENIHETCREVHQHLSQVKAVAEDIGVAFIGLGFAPTWKRSDMVWMPKGRYKIMGEYMPKRGSLGLDMMLRTCTVQVNLDYASEADMVKKFRVSLALQPIATALFANSAFTEGRPNGFLSYRSHIWTDTDPDRCGILPFVFEDGMGFERYVDYMLDVPMYFVYRDGKYIDASGLSFRDFLDGKLAVLPGEIPTISDWADHMTTAFPEVRLKKFLEMRGADGGGWGRLCALPALWVGLLYEQSALDAAWDLVKDWTPEHHDALRAGVPQHGLKMAFRNGTLREVALRVLEIARAGLSARARLDAGGSDETGFLHVLEQIADSGETPAERKLALFEGRWQGDLSHLFKEFAY
ncbi:MAG: glutamate--cysteine ligase [Burkholderiaceae bacterium]